MSHRKTIQIYAVDFERWKQEVILEKGFHLSDNNELIMDIADLDKMIKGLVELKQKIAKYGGAEKDKNDIPCG